jgi:hypothetical protein
VRVSISNVKGSSSGHEDPPISTLKGVQDGGLGVCEERPQAWSSTALDLLSAGPSGRSSTVFSRSTSFAG